MAKLGPKKYGIQPLSYSLKCEVSRSDQTCEQRVVRAQAIIDEAIGQVRELGCGLVVDGTVEGNGVWFDALRVQDRQSAIETSGEAAKGE